jgi:hypothetical protein
VQLTPENHPDYEQLVLAANEIQHVADHINEIKRRKELIEQLIGEKKRVDRNVSCVCKMPMITTMLIYFH